ncbi:Nucleotide-binding universal stress protein, UspA family [Streptomyces sp. SceaMP-e96]|uniref:universal stress protein n=1 Tax=unclassified Streptomyces TaxID=2593676 RepID=UPI000823CE9D|nr:MULTISPECIES: universal stress protein [unclassified Streptomyces]MYT16747.1 universal stress protein [Streptomyces sp. SID4951]SCK34889.1 Nucleotide-binding universal stress protein, UspA family [Streptomyces sp. SceaMP-e96]
MGGSVVVGLDGTGNSVPAVRWGAEEAAARGLPLHFLHSWISQPLSIPIAQEAANKKRYGAEVLARAEATAHELHPGIPVTTEQVSENAVDALVDRSRQATLMVLGSRGHGAIAGFLLGSVSLHVLGRTECPVVTVREEEAVAYGRPEVVVSAQEAGTTSEAVLNFAFAAAAAHHATLRAVRAWEPAVFVDLVPTAPPSGAPDAERETGEEKKLTDLLAPWRAEFPDVDVVEQVEPGRVAPVLLRACSQASLLVVGRRMQRTPMLLGPVVFAVLHHSFCPVAVVPRS